MNDWSKLVTNILVGIGFIVLANDALLFGLSTWTKKIEHRKLEALAKAADDAELKESEGIDWELEEQSLEACYVSRDELSKMTKGQLFALNAWIGEELEIRKENA